MIAARRKRIHRRGSLLRCRAPSLSARPEASSASSAKPPCQKNINPLPLTCRILDSAICTRQSSRLLRRPNSPTSLSSASRRSFSNGRRGFLKVLPTVFLWLGWEREEEGEREGKGVSKEKKERESFRLKLDGGGGGGRRRRLRKKVINSAAARA